MRMGNGIHNSPVKMSIEHAYLGREMCHAANTCNTKNCCGQYFGRYNAVWSIFGWYLVDFGWFIVVNIFYNPAVWLLLPGWWFSHTAAGGFYPKIKENMRMKMRWDEMRWDDDEDEENLQLLNDDLQLFASSLQLI